MNSLLCLGPLCNIFWAYQRFLTFLFLARNPPKQRFAIFFLTVQQAWYSKLGRASFDKKAFGAAQTAMTYHSFATLLAKFLKIFIWEQHLPIRVFGWLAAPHSAIGASIFNSANTLSFTQTILFWSDRPTQFFPAFSWPSPGCPAVCSWFTFGSPLAFPWPSLDCPLACEPQTLRTQRRQTLYICMYIFPNQISVRVLTVLYQGALPGGSLRWRLPGRKKPCNLQYLVTPTFANIR